MQWSHNAQFQVKLNWKMQFRSTLDVAAADGFSLDRTRLELLESKTLRCAHAALLSTTVSLSLSATVPVI